MYTVDMSNESPIVSFRVPLSAIKELIAKGRLKEEYTKSELSNLVKEDWLKSQSIDFNVPVPNSVLEKVLAKLNKIEASGSLWRSQIEKLYIKVLEQYKTHQEKKKFTRIWNECVLDMSKDDQPQIEQH
ncbi:MAG: hypothetical protein AAFR83_10675 [Cyanobacteria bacterium J06629_18]